MGKLLPASVLNQFKDEVAHELGLDSSVQTKGWSEMTSKDCGRVGGKIGGRMVKVMIREIEKSLSL
jgi:hypothetical protein